jgi:TonB family protein
MDKKSEFRILGFTTLSAITHIALVAALVTMNLNSEKSVDTLTMEFPGEPAIAPAPEATKAEIQEIAVTEAVTETVQAKATPAPLPEKEIVLPTKAVKPVIAKTLPKATRPAVQAKQDQPVQTVQPEFTQEESPVVLPIVQDAQSVSVEELNEEEVAADLEKVEAEEAEKLAAVQAQMKKEADEVTEKEIKEQQEKAALIQKQNEEEKAKIAKAQEDRKKQEAEAEAIAAAAKAAAVKAAGKGKGEGEMRALADLRQMPGNKIPQFDTDDRLKQRKGDVAFSAMVSKEGMLSEIKLLKSSGHRELDAKTLKAIKSWKFFPGQQGLVEIPMKWELTGEVQAVHGGRLRNGSTTN